MAKLTEKQLQFLQNPFAGVVTTLRPDGSPHSTIVWVDAADDGRATLTTDGADDQIDRLAKKYLGKDEYPWRQPDQTRVTVKIDPVHVQSYGLD